jgi:hypothetical protein
MPTGRIMLSVFTLAGKPIHARNPDAEDKKVEVFEKTQDAEIDADAGSNPEASPCRAVIPAKHLSDDVIHGRGSKDQEGELPIPGRIKGIAAEEKPDLSRGVAAHRPIDNEHNQKKPEEAKFNERHSNREWDANLGVAPRSLTSVAHCR